MKKWLKAMKQEMDSLENNKKWMLVSLSKGRKVINNIWQKQLILLYLALEKIVSSGNRKSR
jgi:heat shock protein HslJ